MSLSICLRHTLGDCHLDVNFRTEAGLTAIFGPSGAGKTTLINAVSGLIRPQAGRIMLGDRCLFDADEKICLPAHKRRIGYVFQEPRLFPHLNVRQNLTYGQWFRAAKRAADFARIVDLLGIGDLLSRQPVHLSGGEKARVAFGRAVLSAPELLIMDEPLAALDAARKQTILPYIEGLRDELGLPILYVSHSAAEVARLANHVLRLDRGRVASFGPAQEVFGHGIIGSGLDAWADEGAVITARYDGNDGDGLARFETKAGPIWLRDGGGAVMGQSLPLRIAARDVMLARERPLGISALNILPCRLRQLDDRGGLVLARLDLAGEILLAEISKRSCQNLGLRLGEELFAIIKAASGLRL